MERGLCHNKLKVTHKDSNVFEAFVRVLKAGQAKYKESDGFDEDHIPFLNSGRWPAAYSSRVLRS